jgi:O-antigen/teichoic acid export membrane protein
MAIMLLGFASFPVLARIYSVADYGSIALTLKIILLATVISKFGLQNSIQRFYAEEVKADNPVSRRTFYSTLLAAAFLIGGTTTLLFVGGLSLTPHAWLSRSLRVALLVAAVLILTRCLQPMLMSFLRAEGRTKSYNGVDIGLKAVTLLIVFGILFTISRTTTAFFIGTATAEIAALVLFLAVLQHAGLLNFVSIDRELLKRALLFGAPLIGYELASVILDSGDRIVVQYFLGAQAVGHYSAAYNIATYTEEALMQPINLALFPIYMKLWTECGASETQGFLSRSLHNFLLLAIGVVAIVTMTSRDVVVVLASKKFADASHLLPVLVAGLLIYAIHIFLNAALLIYKKTVVMTKLVVIACVANLALNVILLPRIGISGAAWATLISYGLLVVLMGRVSFRLLPLRINYRSIALAAVAASVAMSVAIPVHLQHAFLNVVVRTITIALLYTGFLVAVDEQVRAVASRLLGWEKLKQAKQTALVQG